MSYDLKDVAMVRDLRITLQRIAAAMNDIGGGTFSLAGLSRITSAEPVTERDNLVTAIAKLQNAFRNGKFQAHGEITLSANSVSTIYGSSASLTFETNSNGTVTAESANTGVATVSVEGDTVTVTGTGTGATTITFKSAATIDYSAASATFTVTVGKAESSMTLSAYSNIVSLNNTITFTVTSQTGDGALSIESADSERVAATISGTTATLTGLVEGSDSVLITVTKAETANYHSCTAVFECTVREYTDEEIRAGVAKLYNGTALEESDTDIKAELMRLFNGTAPAVDTDIKTELEDELF